MSSLIELSGDRDFPLGEVLPTGLVLSVLTGRIVRFNGVRDESDSHGLSGVIRGAIDVLRSVTPAVVDEPGKDPDLVVEPRGGPSAGDYEFDLTRHRADSGVGCLALQPMVLVLLSRAEGTSSIRFRGVTHKTGSPGFALYDYVLPALLEPLGFRFTTSLERWGFSPDGEGLVRVTVEGAGSTFDPAGLKLTERGNFVGLTGVSAVGNLAPDVLRRQTRAANERLAEAGFDPVVESVTAESHQPGTAVELTAEYEEASAAFQAVGQPDKRAETVARETVSDFLRYHRGQAPLARNHAETLLLPVLTSSEGSELHTREVTRSLRAAVHLAGKIQERRVSLEGEVGEPGRVVVGPE